MQANPLIPSSSNARNLGGGKDLIQRLLLVWYNSKARRIETLADARCWMGRSRSASGVYCSIWISGPHAEWSGCGTAGGHGYHKASAALSAALRSAGWELDEDIDGVGDNAMRDALLAIGRKLKGPRAVLEVLS
jgi:hypothetical protein